MKFYNVFAIALLLIISSSVLIRQKYYLVTSSVNKTYRFFMFVISLSTVLVTFLIYKSLLDFVLGIIFSIIFLLLSFMRKGITEKALIGIKGDYCTWDKVSYVRLVKKNNLIQLIYNHSGGESNMYFYFSDYERLIDILNKILNSKKINIEI